MARRWLARTVFVVAVGLLVAFGYVTGLGRVPFLGVREAVFSMLSFAGFVLVCGALFAHRMGRDPEAPPIDTRITAIVPTYRDSGVLHRSVESLLAASHPVEVVVACEPDDEAGIERAKELAAGEDAVRVFVNERPGTKAGAINDAVSRTNADMYGVFDADQAVPEYFFDAVAGNLRANDVVQARFLPATEGLVESLAYYEYTLFNYCFRQPLYAVANFRMATSKALLFTRDAFEFVGGYDPEMISEDNDFGHRGDLKRREVALTDDTEESTETDHNIRDWWGQRKRWMRGNAEVLHRKLLPGWWENPTSASRYVSLAIGLGSVGGAAFLVSLVPKFAWVLPRAPAVALAPVLSLYAVALYARRRDGLPIGWEWLLLPLVLPFFSLITLAALAEYAVGAGGEWFAVEKEG
jgi:cellulose synthase/poly-beta-1,6-N-acetylglucosamine synthase-like glycosyltransferase